MVQAFFWSSGLAFLLFSIGVAGYPLAHWLRFGTFDDPVSTRTVLAYINVPPPVQGEWVGLQHILTAVLDASAAYPAFCLALLAFGLALAARSATARRRRGWEQHTQAMIAQLNYHRGERELQAREQEGGRLR